MSNSILSIQDVVKAYEKNIAVNHISFDMPSGGIFGLLGPNGAGKSSLIRMITHITRPDSGVIYFGGEKLNSLHPERIGYMPEERGLYKKMKIGDHLMYLAQLKGLSYTDARREVIYWLEKLQISDWWNKKVEELSKGMQQKAQFISTVVHKPALLILDEPFSGLDPVNAETLKNEIYELAQKGTSIIFSTHRMEQVEEICDNIVLINKGKVVIEGSVKDVKNRFKENIFECSFNGQLSNDLQNKLPIVKLTDNNAQFKITNVQSTQNILKTLVDANVELTSFNEILPSLNEIFIKQVSN